MHDFIIEAIAWGGYFGIFVLTPEKHWWRGTALNPFDVWVFAGT